MMIGLLNAAMFGTNAQGQWTLVDDMEGVNNWTNLQGTTGLAADPVDPTNTAFQAIGNSPASLMGQAFLPMPAIADGTVGTVFFRVYTESNGSLFDLVVGSSDQANPSAGFNDFDGYGRFNDGNADVRNASVTGNFSEVGPASSGTWYNVWLVQNNNLPGSNDTTDFYYNTSGPANTASTPFFKGAVFRNGEATDLVSLMVRNNEFNSSVNAYIDDVYIDTSGENLNNPLTPFVDNDPIPDGMDDNWEIANFGSIEFSDGTSDQEPDGLTDLEEFNNGTNPFVADTDEDGLEDGPEVNATLNDGVTPTGFAATNPTTPDSDAGMGGLTDGINDFDEVTGALNTAFGNAPTDPNSSDSDGDGMDDGYELANNEPSTGLDPNDDGSSDASQAPSGDRDGDTLTNIQEYDPTLGVNATSPQTRADIADTDGDGYDDFAESNSGFWNGETDTGTNPLVVDTDGDGLEDGEENLDLTFSPGAIPTNSDPNLSDTDGDGFIDIFEVNSSTNPDDDTSAPTRSAGFTLVEDFQGAGMVVGSTFSGVNGWTSDVPEHATVADEPIAGGGDQVGCLDRNGSGQSEHFKRLDLLGLQINPLGTGTLFFQVYASSPDLGISVGLSDQSVPTSFDSFEAQSVFGRNPAGSLRVRNGGVFEDVGTYTGGVWMNVWIVANNETDTLKLFIESPVGESGRIEVSLPFDPVGFRNGTSDSLNTLLAVIAGNSPSGNLLCVDNFYVDPEAENLTLPAAAKPTTNNDLEITNLAFNGSGDLEITFSPGGEGYILTSSDNLSDPFLEETGASYDGIDTFTIPAASLNTDRDFFRVETSP